MSTSNLQHSAARPLTEDTFRVEIEDRPGIALVDFGADWCPPCRMMAPVIERIASEYGERVTVGTLDVDTNPRVQARYNVRSLPTFLFFQDGALVDRIVGAVPKSRLTERLDALLAGSATPTAQR
jgi:thioredoxin 1